MSVLFLLVPLALALVGVFVALYVWSTRSGQFDDLHTPALRALLDERPARAPVPPEAPAPMAPRVDERLGDTTGDTPDGHTPAN